MFPRGATLWLTHAFIRPLSGRHAASFSPSNWSSRLGIALGVLRIFPDPQSRLGGPMPPFQELLKRGFDIVGATACLALLSPLITIVSLAIKLESQGPVLRRRKYYSLNDAAFEAFEFRSTSPGIPGDITRIGQILRLSDLDKIPLLINVLRGDLSLVGPQPLTTPSGTIYRARIAWNRLRNVRPGIFSWARACERGATVSKSAVFSHRVEDDCYYLTNRSFLLDMKILMLAMLSWRART
jgi:putative colanic acid biosynthesis UDP-glucose lipid carrier transferase